MNSLNYLFYPSLTESPMAGINSRDILLGLFAVGLIVLAVYLIDPTLGGLMPRKYGFQASTLSSASLGSQPANFPGGSGAVDRAGVMQNPHVASSGNEGFTSLTGYEGPSEFGNAETPEGCYPRDQLTPGELLPKDTNSVWAQQNPMGTGSLKGKNFLSAGALIGINTVGQSMRNANYQLRSEPPNPQVAVSVFNQSTIEPDTNRRSLEIS
uniref:Minor capsid protein P11 C-terminal conserved region domain-containing protein n=1 Tax=viral metagenome TaxID=1070528 RepID=A0A6C0LQB6_9ZZZZ